MLLEGTFETTAQLYTVIDKPGYFETRTFYRGCLSTHNKFII